MNNDLYTLLHAKVKEMNNLNDEVCLARYNLEDGPKIKNIKELQELNNKIINNEFDYLLDDDQIDRIKVEVIDSFNHELEDIYFYGYTNKKNDKYITYLSLKKKGTKSTIDKMCGIETNDPDSAHTYLMSIEDVVKNDSVSDILKELIKGADKKILQLKKQLVELTSES